MRRSAYRRLSEDEEDDEADGYAEDDDDQVRDDAPSSVSFRRHSFNTNFPQLKEDGFIKTGS